MHALVVHYKELALKGKNRSWFVQVLVRNIGRRSAVLASPVSAR